MPSSEYVPSAGSTGLRIFAWATVLATVVFLVNNYLNYWQGWPGAGAALGEGGALAILQLGLYAAAVLAAAAYVLSSTARSLRADAATIHRINLFIIRFAFWSVLLVGIADIVVSFLRVENMLADYVGAERAASWGFNETRAPELHLPLVGVAFLLSLVTRTLGFQWLALAVVLAEFLIVVTRFIFSYEQAFQGDLVRFWYGALFLFASAYTLYEDGHVRVDVIYSGMSVPTQGFFNVLGCLVMGILFCWIILIMGMAGPAAAINAPLQSLEITQAGFGMYVKYMMAAFLAVFAATMMFQFASYLLDSAADWRGDPGGRQHHVHGEAGESEVV